MDSNAGGSIAELCQRTLDGVQGLSVDSVDRIRDRLPSYSVVPVAEHVESTRRQFITTLKFVAENRADIDPRGAELEDARELGRLRALQGLALADVIESFHLGSRELWRTMIEKSPGNTRQLLYVGGMMWDLVHAATTAVAIGHNEATRTVQAVRANRRSQLFDLLERGEATEQARTLAAALDFDPDQPFGAISTPGINWSDVQLQDLQEALDVGQTTALCSRREHQMVTVFQVGPSSTVVDAIRLLQSDVSVGIGLMRPGLRGASASMRDAQRALALVDGHSGTADFFDFWLSAILFEHRGELEPILGSGTTIGAQYPHLAEAVIAFAHNGFSTSAAARALHLHTNSLAYRLERWQQLSGWDLRTFDGLVRSMISLTSS